MVVQDLPRPIFLRTALWLIQGFFSKSLMGGEDSKFSVPVSPRRGQSRMGEGEGTCEKNPTEAKEAKNDRH